MDAPAAENGNGRHVDARALRFAILFPVLLCLGLTGGALLLAGSLPGGAELPTGGGPLPLPVFMAVAVGATLLLGAGIGSFGAQTRLPRNLRRLLLGAAMALQLGSVTIFSAALLGQSGAGGAAPQRLDGYVALMGSGLAASMGLILALTFKPDEQWTGSDDDALADMLELEADPTAANDRLAYAIHPRSSVIIMILLAGLLPGAVLTVVSAWFLAAFGAAALLAVGTLCATVQVDRSSLAVKMAGLVPVIVLACSEVEAAVSLDIKARDYGGWGLRKHRGTESFLAYSGAAVVLRNVRGRAVLSAPNLDTADDLAAILNRRAGKLPGQH
ncbi:hypothetical protein [Arthrobacter wenxiniae]|uniref:PH domain-containing protein n=1 Tax=Arthrobacter wenxiniae TaxID=2713570 RepID=A0A7Y7LY23_9MICC|nr:hypothetical protein [Arthrobacter wenxiniae]NVM94492.1 hypothetical protein [Arthrobacter wenxiniae]